jgi:hypothetical protein
MQVLLLLNANLGIAVATTVYLSRTKFANRSHETPWIRLPYYLHSVEGNEHMLCLGTQGSHRSLFLSGRYHAWFILKYAPEVAKELNRLTTQNRSSTRTQ